jgi:nicotinamidase-related amidase
MTSEVVFMKQALILVDIQNEYFELGRVPLDRLEKAAANAKRALGFFRDKNMPVCHIRHVNLRDGAVTFLPDSFRAEIHESVAPIYGESVIVKHYPSAFLKTGLADELKRHEIGQLVICGMMSHMCIDTTVRAAMDYGFTVTLLEDACTTKDLIWNDQIIPAETVHRAFMAALDGMFARVITTEEFMDARQRSDT